MGSFLTFFSQGSAFSLLVRPGADALSFICPSLVYPSPSGEEGGSQFGSAPFPGGVGVGVNKVGGAVNTKGATSRDTQPNTRAATDSPRHFPRGKTALALLVFLFSCSTSPAQQFALRGYVKNIQTFFFTDQENSLLSSGFVHNRLAFQWSPDSLTGLHAEMRNRLFYGDLVRVSPLFAEELSRDPGYFDLSFNTIERNALVMNSAFDRLYIEYRPGRWRFRAGRQRVNWGIATTWNPNDLFNAYNFLDFDYEERPGADALRAEYQLGGFSHVEAVFSPSRQSRAWIGGARYTGHRGSYDWQLIGAYFKNRLAIGGGWAGDLGRTGFKGEWTVFQPLDTGKTTLSFTLGSDYLFGKNWLLNGAVLWNTRASGAVQSPETLAGATLSPDNLFPARLSMTLGLRKEITPLLNGSLALVYAPDAKMLIALPSFAVSVADNWTADLTGQLFFGQSPAGNFGNRFNAVYARWRWSF